MYVGSARCCRAFGKGVVCCCCYDVDWSWRALLGLLNPIAGLVANGAGRRQSINNLKSDTHTHTHTHTQIHTEKHTHPFSALKNALLLSSMRNGAPSYIRSSLLSLPVVCMCVCVCFPFLVFHTRPPHLNTHPFALALLSLSLICTKQMMWLWIWILPERHHHQWKLNFTTNWAASRHI